MHELTSSLLTETAEHFTRARKSVLEGAKGLYLIRESNMWEEGGYGSFSAFCEEACQLSKGQASKWIAVYERFVLPGVVSPAKLEEVDAEKLYIALSLPGEPDEQYAKAATLTRDELREEVREEKNGICTHENEPYELYRKYPCGKWVLHQP